MIEKLFRQLNEIEAVPGVQIETGNEVKTPALFERGGGAADERADEGREYVCLFIYLFTDTLHANPANKLTCPPSYIMIENSIQTRRARR